MWKWLTRWTMGACVLGGAMACGTGEGPLFNDPTQLGPDGAVTGGASASGGASPSGGASSGGFVSSTGGSSNTGGLASGGSSPATGGIPSTTGGTSGTMPSCTDLVKNAGETDIDCGGATCAACADGKRCLQNSDCSARNCVAGTCAALPTCSDHVRNGAETDVDCGGNCPTCATGKLCASNTDCQSTLCSGGICVCKPQTCADIAHACGTVSNGCGGTLTCGPCALLCGDKVKDGNETDVDCGGPDCRTCPNGATCAKATDCESGVCPVLLITIPGFTNVCAVPSCVDRVRNGAETDVDCGGPSCAKCATGNACKVDTDCSKGPCVSKVCTCTPFKCTDDPLACGVVSNGCGSFTACQPCKNLCADKVKDGNETDVDCGGTDCAKCTTGQHCRANTDCDTASCKISQGSLLCQ